MNSTLNGGKDGSRLGSPALVEPSSYFNWMTLETVKTAGGISIVPRPTPTKAITILTSVIGALVLIGVFACCLFSATAFLWALVPIGVATTAGTPALILYYYRKEQRLGPVLHFDSEKRTFELLRAGKSFPLKEIAGFRIVTDHLGEDQVSQLQLCAKNEGPFLLVPTQLHHALKAMLKELLAFAPVNAWLCTKDSKAPGGWREEVFGRNTSLL